MMIFLKHAHNKRKDLSKEEKKVYASFLAERLYGTFTILVLNIGLLSDVENIGKKYALLAIITTTIGLVMASFFSKEMAHKVVHGKAMDKVKVRKTLASKVGIIMAAVPSLIFVSLSYFGLFNMKTALEITVVSEVITILVYVIRAAYTRGGTKLTRLISISLQFIVAAIIVAIKLFVH